MTPTEMVELRVLMGRAIRRAAREAAHQAASCHGKQKFDTPLDASRAMRRPGLMSYRCVHCQKWHVGQVIGHMRQTA